MGLFLFNDLAVAGSLNKVAVWKRADGVSITYFDDRGINDGETEEQYINREIENIRPNFPGIEPIIVDKANVPKERIDRKYWKLQDGEIVTDEMKKYDDYVKDQQKIARKNTVLQKLKITEEDLKDVLN